MCIHCQPQAREAAEEAARQAEAARVAAEEAKAKAEAQVEEARQKFAEAEAYLEEVKNTLGAGQGWWMDRELTEKKKYLPLSKGGILRK